MQYVYKIKPVKVCSLTHQKQSQQSVDLKNNQKQTPKPKVCSQFKNKHDYVNRLNN